MNKAKLIAVICSVAWSCHLSVKNVHLTDQEANEMYQLVRL